MLKLQLAESHDIADNTCRDSLEISERNGEESQRRTEHLELMKREITYQTLENMSLESLLYHVLVGDGRVLTKTVQT